MSTPYDNAILSDEALRSLIDKENLTPDNNAQTQLMNSLLEGIGERAPCDLSDVSEEENLWRIDIESDLEDFIEEDKELALPAEHEIDLNIKPNLRLKSKK